MVFEKFVHRDAAKQLHVFEATSSAICGFAVVCSEPQQT